MYRASKNESASTSGSDREGPSEGSLKHTVLTSSLDLVSKATPFARKKKMRKGLVTVHTTFRPIPHL